MSFSTTGRKSRGSGTRCDTLLFLFLLGGTAALLLLYEAQVLPQANSRLMLGDPDLEASMSELERWETSDGQDIVVMALR